ncbi:C-terminal region of aryl-sulfatase [Prosthecobacter debontii]|uniref:C-terminal region of aryl-sulfatase n=1 Tax=Prosthecobacter debontii TaxID=48467 RepID=A0A1T4YIB5_9BACT|nr:sulfatase [Prosthecobacter debontii]SKB01519.1 C-terminal region of aryl-sulfatase [Prosthecobacter debontii]
MRYLLAAVCLSLASLVQAANQPNIVVIFMDDMGYADVSCFGAQGYTTPNIDRLAQEGRKFTNFHVPQPVCSASRAGLLTGCYPNRIGIHGALSPKATHGLSADEMTLAELVKQKGYATAAVGKWHLGHLPPFLPTQHGFDEYYGLPYSNDMWPFHPEAKPGSYPKLPMIENDHVVDEEVTPEDQTRLTTDYTTKAVGFIDRNKDKPFFLYLAHSMVHVPLYVSEKYNGKSGKGLFADVMMEVDWSVGQVMQALEKNGLKDNTWVIFTSDNGPWLSYGDHAGSAGILREGKGTIWEGGTRVTGIMRWPEQIPAGTTTDTMMMTIDLLPTVAAVIGADLPDHPIDGMNVWPIIHGEEGAKNPHDSYAFYYHQNELQAVTSGDGRWKLILPHTFRTLGNQSKATGGKPVKYQPEKVLEAELYDLYADLSESKNLAAQSPEIMAELQKQAVLIRAELGDQLMKMPRGKGTREAGHALAK